MKSLLKIALIFTFFVLSVQETSANINTSSFINKSNSNSSFLLRNTPLSLSGTITGPINVCLNQPNANVTFTGSGGTAPYTFTYKIGTGANTTIVTTIGDSVTLPIVTTATGTFVYTLVSIIEGSGTAVPITGQSVTITVNALPTITGDLNICDNSTSQLTGSGIATLTNPWTSSDLTKATISSTGLVSAVTPGTSNIIYTNSLGCIRTVVFTVKALPVADFAFTNNQCSGNSVSFNSTATGTGPFTYAWTFSNGGTSSLEDPSHVFNAGTGNGTQNFSVTLVITNTITNCEKSITKTVSVKQKPDASLFTNGDGTNATIFDISQGIFINCGATSSSPQFEFIALNSSSTASSNTSYTIDWGDNTGISNYSSSFTSANHLYNSLGFFNIIITAINSTTVCSTSKTYRFFNGNTPSGNLANIGNTTDCVPYTVIWPVENTTDNTPGTTYIFSINDGSPPQNFTQSTLPASISHTFLQSSCGLGLPSNKFTVTFKVTNPCGETEPTTQIQTTLKPVASYTISPSTNNHCTNSNITFTNTSIGNYVPSGSTCSTNFNKTWTVSPSTGWTLSSGALSGPGTDVIVFNFNTPGNYSISLNIRRPGTAASRCTDDTKIQTICIDAPLLPLFTLNKTESCTPAVITTTNTTDITHSCNPPTYLWDVQYADGYCGSTPPTWSYTSGSATTANPSFSFVTPGTYSIKVTMTNSCGAETSAIQTVIVKKPPTVAINAIPNLCQSAGNTTISPTAVVNGCAPATSALTYSWIFSGGIPATSNSAILGAINFALPGSHTVTLSVMNECGTTPDSKTFTINPLPTISGTLFACAGSTSQLSGSATPANTTPWVSSAPTIASVSNTGLVTGITAGTATITYTNNNGCFITALFTVNPLGQVTLPANQVVCVGSSTSTITFATTNTVGATTYAWTNNNIASGLAASGNGNIPAFTTTNTGTSPFTSSITVTPTLTNGTVNCPGPSVTFNITINPTAQVIQPTNAVFCAGTATSATIPFSTSNTGGTTTYNWTIDNTAIGLAASGSGSIPIFTPINNSTAPITATVTVTPSFSNGGTPCAGTSKTFTITINPRGQVNTISNQIICNGGSTAAVAFSTTIIGTTSYSWTNSNSSIGIGLTSIGDIPTFVGANSSNSPTVGNFVVTPTFTNASVSCPGPTQPFSITVNPAPQVNTISNQIVCHSGLTTLVNFTTTNTGTGTVSYNWTNDTPSIGLAASGSGNIAGFSATNIGTAPVFAIITVTPSYANGTVTCVGTAKTFTITVNPKGQVNTIANQTVCNGLSTTAINFGTTNTGGITTYSWTNNLTSIGLSGSGSGNIAAFNAINNTALPVTATITVTPTFANGTPTCAGAQQQFTIVVNPTPSATLTGAASVCVNASAPQLTFTGSSGTAHYTFTYTINGGAPLTATTVSGNSINVSAPTGIVGNYLYNLINVQESSSTACAKVLNLSQTISVTTLPTIATQPLSTQTICVGGTIAPLTVSHVDGLGTPSYKWYTNTTATNTGGTVITGATSVSYIPPVYATSGTYYYYAVVTLSGTGCGIATSLPATVIVVADPIVSVQPLPTQTQCQSNAATQLSVTATGGTGTFTYQWYGNFANNTTSGTSLGATATNNTYTPPTTTVGTVYYYCVIGQTGLGCNVTSAIAAVIVVPAPTINLQPIPSTVCQNGTPTTLSVTYINGTGTASYQWYSTPSNNTTSGTSLGSTAINSTYIPSTATIGTVYYYCIVTLSSGGCTSITSNTASVAVTTLPTIATQPLTSQTICVGGTIAPLTVSHVDGIGTPSYKWYTNTTATNTGGTVITGATSASYTPLVFSAPGTYYYYAVVTLSGTGCGVATSQPATVIVVADPIVSVQPLATQTQCQSNPATQLSVAATGGTGTFTYQWYSNVANNTTSGTSLGATATNNTYTPPTTTVGTVYYYCVIGQTGLGCNVTSAIAAVIVVPAPTINLQPLPSTVCQNGTPTTLSVTYINGTGTATYQWYSNVNNDTTAGTSIGSTAINSTYIPSTATIGTVYYYCIVTLSSGGCTSITSNTASVAVTTLPTIATQPLTSQTICVGGTIAPLTVSHVDGLGTPTYQWYTNTTATNTGGTLITGATTASYTPPAFATSGTYYYYAVITLSGTGCGVATSQPATVIVVADPIVSVQPLATQTQCQSNAATQLSVTATGGTGTFTYQWYSNVANNTTSGTSLGATATNNTYTPPTTTVGTVYYYCMIGQSGLGCNVTSAIAAVIVVPAPTINLQPIPSTVCQNGTPTTLSVTYINGTGTASYQWYSNTIDSTIGGTPVGTNSPSYLPQSTSFGVTYYYCIISLSSSGCTSISSATARVIINANPLVTTAQTQTVCSNSPFSISPSDGSGNIVPVGTSYSWSVPIVTGNMTAGAGGLDQNNINGTLTNPTNMSQTATYSVTPTSNGCSGTSFPVTITVNPTPVIAAVTPAAICSGTSFSVTPINSGAIIVPTGTTYTWTVGVNPNITGQSVSTATGITTISQTLTNGVNTPQSLIYTVTPTSGDAGNCVGTPFTITVTVSPKPTIADVTPAAICSGTSFSVTPSNTASTIVPTGTTYTWTTPVSTPIGAITGGSAQPTGESSIGQLLANTTNSTGTLDYTVTPISGSCQGNPFHIIVTVNPIPGTLSLTNISYCNGVLTAPIVFSNSVTGTTYAWTNSNPLIGFTPVSGVGDIPAFTATNGGATAITATLSVIATANGCSRVAETFTITVNPSPAVTFTPTNQSICSGDSSALVTLGSATAGATYSWTAVQPTGITGVTLLGNNTIPVQTLTNSTNVAIVVTYSATATIAGGATCEGAVYTYTITVKPKPTIENQTKTICNNQNFSIDPLNGIPSILTIVPIGTLYTWTVIQNPNITGASDDSGALISQTLTNLSDTLQSIVYNVTPSYLNCDGNSFTVTVNVNPTPNIIFSIPNQIICNNTQNTPINLNSNAVGTINYSWICNNPPPISELTGLILSGTTNTIPTQLLVNNTLIPIVITYVVSAEISGSVTCQGPPSTYTITVNPTITTSSILTNYNSYNVSYFGGTDGAIDLTVSGGSGIYTYNWTGPNSFISTSQDISNLVAGNYTVNINDGYCNPVTLNFTLTQPPELLIQETIAAHYNLLCFGDSNGTLGVTITQESVAPYDYQLLNSSGVVINFINNTNSLSHVFNTISAGVFSIKVIDANGGVKTISGLTLSQPNDIVITAATTPITCYGGNDASLILTVTGGTFPYTGSWDNLATGLSQNNLSAGTYIIVVKDANNCSKPITVIIPEAPIFTVNPVVANISCFGANDGSINLNFIGGIAPVVLTWSDGSTAGTTRNNLGPGTYSVIIRDSKPCYINKTFIIVEPQLLVLASNITNALDCNDANSGSINLLVSGGNPPFTYLWSNGATTEDLTNVVAGNYSVAVIDSKGCTKSAQYVISRPPPIILGVQTNTVFDCVSKIVKQTFVAQASGGVPYYIYNWSSGTVSGPNNETMDTATNGMILLQATDAIGCSTNYTFNVDIPTLGDISFNSNSYAYATYGSYSINDPIQFNNIASGDFISVNWSFGDGTYSTELNPIHQYISTGTYIITQTVTYPFGCVYNNVTSIIVGEGYALVIPNAFTPNNDALNAFFQPEYKGLSDFTLDVYDTWGELIYSEKGDAIRGWDGKVKGQDSENGNYYYKVSGKTFYGKIIEKQASFVLIK